MMLLRKYFWGKDIKYLCFLYGVEQGLEGLICINIQFFTYLVFKLQSIPFICAEVLNGKDAIHQALHAGNLLFPALLKDCIALPLKLILAYLFIPHGINILRENGIVGLMGSYKSFSSQYMKQAIHMQTRHFSMLQWKRCVSISHVDALIYIFLLLKMKSARLKHEKDQNHTKRLSCSMSAAC
jgi:hypothetical protein